MDCISEESGEGEVLRLHYFKAYGRAEPIRVLLAHAGVKYENVYHEKFSEEYKKAKEDSSLLEFGQLPVLQINGHSHA